VAESGQATSSATSRSRVIDLSDPYRFTSTEQEGLARAVRASIRGQVIDLLERRGLLHRKDLLRCPECGDRVILLEQPGTFVYDRRRGQRLCAACGAERDLLVIMDPVVDIGGEGGG
jgi:DNA-directed RNA polymerase subunit RPC12/RpoP